MHTPTLYSLYIPNNRQIESLRKVPPIFPPFHSFRATVRQIAPSSIATARRHGALGCQDLWRIGLVIPEADFSRNFSTRWGPGSLAKLVYNSNFTMVFR